MATTTDKLLNELNALRGLTYPDVGYLYFADVHGDGRANRKRVYMITNRDGGVTFTEHNATSARARCDAIRRDIERAKTFVELPDARYTANLEFCGYDAPRYVPRFCGEWIRKDGAQVPACIVRDAAVAYCVLAYSDRLAAV